MGSKAFKPTLINSNKIARYLEHPERNIKCIHVAGSNGKGSTCSMLASTLKEGGYKVGLFTSPHIKDFTERIRINGIEINQEFVVNFIQKIKSSPLDFEPSFFEITFGMALEFFNTENCDVCIIETGLGGRFDATNIIHPILSIITNISLEHTNMLGDTLEKIAFEKAGIIKRNTPVVLGKMEGQLYPIFEKIANECHSILIKSEYKTFPKKYNSPLLGEYQEENLRTVLSSIEALNEIGLTISNMSITNGLENLTRNTGFYGRLQVVSESPLTIFDVSHNTAGIEASIDAIQAINKGKIHIVYGTSADKDVSAILNLMPDDANYYFTQFKNPRTIEISALKMIVSNKKMKNAHFFLTSEKAFLEAQNNANHTDTILVIGSFFLISDFF